MFTHLDNLTESIDLETVAIDGTRFYKVPSGKMYPSCLLYTSPSPRDGLLSRMPSSA